MRFERFVHHVFNDGAWGIEGACLLAGCGLGFLVVTGQQVLEHLAQQFRVKRDFLIDRRVFDDGELVGVQDVQQAAHLLPLALGVAVCPGQIFFVLATEEKMIGDGWALFLVA